MVILVSNQLGSLASRDKRNRWNLRCSVSNPVSNQLGSLASRDLEVLSVKIEYLSEVSNQLGSLASRDAGQTKGAALLEDMFPIN